MFATDFLTICREANSILLTGPQSLDGDSIGACLALRDMIAEKSHATIDVCGIPTHQYTHLSHIDQWKPNDGLLGKYDVAIVVDGDRFRLDPNVETAFNASLATVLIDHHKSTDTTTYTLAWLELQSRQYLFDDLRTSRGLGLHNHSLHCRSPLCWDSL